MPWPNYSKGFIYVLQVGADHDNRQLEGLEGIGPIHWIEFSIYFHWPLEAFLPTYFSGLPELDQHFSG
jgi:hypothetical protein